MTVRDRLVPNRSPLQQCCRCFFLFLQHGVFLLEMRKWNDHFGQQALGGEGERAPSRWQIRSIRVRVVVVVSAFEIFRPKAYHRSIWTRVLPSRLRVKQRKLQTLLLLPPFSFSPTGRNNFTRSLESSFLPSFLYSVRSTEFGIRRSREAYFRQIVNLRRIFLCHPG